MQLVLNNQHITCHCHSLPLSTKLGLDVMSALPLQKQHRHQKTYSAWLPMTNSAIGGRTCMATHQKSKAGWSLYWRIYKAVLKLPTMAQAHWHHPYLQDVIPVNHTWTLSLLLTRLYTGTTTGWQLYHLQGNHGTMPRDPTADSRQHAQSLAQLTSCHHHLHCTWHQINPTLSQNIVPTLHGQLNRWQHETVVTLPILV